MDKIAVAVARDILLPASPERRVFIKGVGLVSTGLLLATLGGCEQLIEDIENRPTRRWIGSGSASVNQDLATYAQAVAAMKALPSNNPINWANVAAIHGTVAAGFIWCQHGTPHFFDWHRGYVLNFERICQKLTGNSKFGMPYWNWNQNPSIPSPFLDSSSVLYMSRVSTSLSGDPTGSTTSGALDPIFADSNFYTFSSQLEGTPHNTVHSYIGGSFPFGNGGSASDPLFWAHHCMVDYCWYKWNIELGNDNTNDSSWTDFLDSHYVDANENPASDTAAITTVMPLLSYQYESSAIGSYPAQARLRRRELQIVEKRIRQGANVKLAVNIRLHLADRAAVTIGKPLSLTAARDASESASILNADLSREHVFASVEYVDLPTTSDFAVRVFLDLPTANRDTPMSDPHYAGSFAFFGTPLREPSAAPGAHQHQPKFLVSLNAAIQRLQQRGEFKGSSISIQLVAVPFKGSFEREDIEVVLTSADIITTPVIIRSLQR
jgi:tyrosinase